MLYGPYDSTLYNQYSCGASAVVKISLLWLCLAISEIIDKMYVILTCLQIHRNNY